MVESHKKIMSKLFSYDYHHCDVVKCHQILNIEKVDTGKNDGFCLLGGICKEYIKRNIIKVVLRKGNAHSVVTCSLTENQ